MSRIPKFGQKLGVGSSRTTDEITELPIIRKPVRTLRRSKSFSDLSGNTPFCKPSSSSYITKCRINSSSNSTSKIIPMINNKPSTSKSYVKLDMNKPVAAVSFKRKAGNVEPEVKPKVLKKVPDWDFKTKYNNLLPKYKQCQTLISDLKKTSEKYPALLVDNDNLKQEKENLLFQVNTLTPELASLKKHAENIEKELKEANEKNRQLEELNEKLQRENQLINFNYDCMKREYELCKELYDQTKEDKKFYMEEYQRVEIIRRELHEEIQNIKGNIRVICRLRPPISDLEQPFQVNFNFPNPRKIEISRCRSSTAGSRLIKDELLEFTFDRVFGQDATQKEVFDELSQLIQSALDGYNICVFAYGQTGSGKTYTMKGVQGTEEMGMIPRSIELIFNKKQQLEKMNWSVSIQASFLEIYNENIRDLLDKNNKKPLNIFYNKGKGTTVSNLAVVPFTTAEELNSCMFKAFQNRSTAETHANEHSSRSHAVTKIYIEGRSNDLNTSFLGSVSLVDLAGSESAKCVMTDRLAETKNINKSLSCLGNVLMALHKKDNHIPYRNSKLTFLLQSSLGGNCKCLMMVNISPDDRNYGETINTLRFAAKVKEVKTEFSSTKSVSAINEAQNIF